MHIITKHICNIKRNTDKFCLIYFDDTNDDHKVKYMLNRTSMVKSTEHMRGCNLNFALFYFLFFSLFETFFVDKFCYKLCFCVHCSAIKYYIERLSRNKKVIFGWIYDSVLKTKRKCSVVCSKVVFHKLYLRNKVSSRKVKVIRFKL